MKLALFATAALLTAAAMAAPASAATIKPGRWQFTTQLQAPAASAPGTPTAPSGGAPSPGAMPPQAGGAEATYTSCIASDKAVPVEFGAQCKLEKSARHGERLTWSMLCTNSQAKVRSDGVAQYHGETMEGTLTSHLPGAGGAVTDMTQRITGRYLGACLQPADMPMTPSHPTAPPRETAQRGGPESPGKAALPVKAAATADDRATAAARPEDAPATRRYAHRGHYRHHAHYARWYAQSYGYSGGYSGFGPAPYSNSGD
ncbi:MAG TPA: DUF3617 family protein [Stellaceae bacterium]|nr:DUF3617 family protein [Stellaceae bacterium]